MRFSVKLQCSAVTLGRKGAIAMQAYYPLHAIALLTPTVYPAVIQAAAETHFIHVVCL